MKTLTLLLSLISTGLLAQQKVLVAPGEELLFVDITFNEGFYNAEGKRVESVPEGYYVNDTYLIEYSSRYLFDDDEGIETIISNEGENLTHVGAIGSGPSQTYPGVFVTIMEGPDHATLVTNEGTFSGYTFTPLPGHTPSYQKPVESVSRVDTVYVYDTLVVEQRIVESRVDTVQELITERIYTSDTVYINETVTLEGDVDTLYINRTVTNRDTVYLYTENTINTVNTRVDSVYLVGGQFGEDVVLSLDNNALVNETLKAYPNPATDYTTIASYTDGEATLKLYNTLGKVVEAIKLVPGMNNTKVDVREFPAGVYLYMVIDQDSRSTVKRLIVE